LDAITGAAEMTENIKNPWGFNDLMVIAAFRYCLGRSTYIVGTCVDWLTEHWPNFSVDTQQLIKKELEEAFKSDNEDREKARNLKTLGWDCDRNDWERVRQMWMDEDDI
jgi:hypothetical protein